MTKTAAAAKTASGFFPQLTRSISDLGREWDNAVMTREQAYAALAHTDCMTRAPRAELQAAETAHRAAMWVGDQMKRARPHSLIEAAEKLRVLSARYGDENGRILEPGLVADFLADLQAAAAQDNFCGRIVEAA